MDVNVWAGRLAVSRCCTFAVESDDRLPSVDV